MSPVTNDIDKMSCLRRSNRWSNEPP